MIRLVLLIGLIVLTIYIIKKLYFTTPEVKQQTQLMKKCAQCSMHIPEQHAIQHNGLFFCNEAHRDEFKNQ